MPLALQNSPMGYDGNQTVFEGDWSGFNAVSDAALNKPAQTFVVADGTPTGESGYFDQSIRPQASNPADPHHSTIIARVAWANCFYNGDPTLCGGDQDDIGNLGPYTGAQLQTFMSQARHSGGENLDYADGHAKWSRDTQITMDLLFGDQAN